MTPTERLEQIRKREREAFKAPWTYTRFAVECDHEEDCGWEHEVLRVESPDEYPQGQIVADVPGLEEFAEANGEFIAHAREDVPWLLAEVDRLRVIAGSDPTTATRDDLRRWTAQQHDEIRELRAQLDTATKALEEAERLRAEHDREMEHHADQILNLLTAEQARRKEAEAALEEARRERDHFREEKGEMLGEASAARERIRVLEATLQRTAEWCHQGHGPFPAKTCGLCGPVVRALTPTTPEAPKDDGPECVFKEDAQEPGDCWHCGGGYDSPQHHPRGNTDSRDGEGG